MSLQNSDNEKQWFALRDLKRHNTLTPAYKLLSEEGIEVFTPMRWLLTTRGGRRVSRQVPVMQDLLFAYDTRSRLDPIVDKTPTLQYRYKKGGKYCEPIVVPEDDMNRFIEAVKASENPRYYSAEELAELKCGSRIRIVGGALNGQEGTLLSVRGSRTKHIVIELQNLMAISVEIKNEYILLA